MPVVGHPVPQLLNACLDSHFRLPAQLAGSFADIRNKDADPARYWKDNEDEVISDMLEIATDYIAFFQDDPEFNYTLNSSVSLSRFLEARDDKVAGWRAVFNFEMPFSRNICIIPD